MDQIELVGYVPGALGRIVELHGSYYAEHWQLGLYFEAQVATKFAEFLAAFDPERDGAWFARIAGKIVGGVFIQHTEAGARLRWFIIDSQYRGYGLGNKLLTTAMDFCRQKKYPRVYLTTFAGLDAAIHLYEKYGFRLIHEGDSSQLTGRADLIEQEFECLL